jgi:hypothetical protein
LKKNINILFLVSTVNKLSLIKSTNNLTRMKRTNSLSLVKNIIEHVVRKRVLRRPVVFHRVHCSILIVLIKLFVVTSFVVAYPTVYGIIGILAHNKLEALWKDTVMSNWRY